MPIYLDVQSRFDERSARKAADQATEHFTGAGKTIGEQFSENLSAGLRSSDAAFRKSAENAEKVYKKAQDAAGAARVEESKLDDLRTKGAGGTALLTQTERLEKARRAEASTTRTAVTAFRDLNDAQIVAASSAGKLHQTLTDLATRGLASQTFLRQQDITKTFDLLGGISTKAVAAAAGIGVVGVAVGVAGKALYDLGASWDSVGDTITGRTGIMGDQLNVITDSIKQVGSQSAISFEDIGNFAGGVAQSLHLTGDEATAMTQKLADIQQVTSQVVDTRSLGKAFRLFDVTDVDTEIQTLQQLTAASQATQIPINDLLTTLGNTGRASKEAGLNLQETLGVMLTLEDAGVSFDKAGPALSIALKNWSKDGRDANVALAETVTKIKALVDAGNDPAATKLASETFGKGYIDFLSAIKGGSLDVNNLTAALEKLGGAGDIIGDQKKATEDWAEEFKKLGHTLSTDLAPVANTIFGSINKALEWSSRNLHAATQDVKDLSTSINSLNPDKLAGALGLPGMPGAPAAPAGPGLPTTRPGTPTTGLAPNFYKDWYKTPEELKREQGSQKLPGAPAVGYDTSLPPGFAGVPQTSEIVGAENSWMDARHTLAEKQKRLQQLEGDNNATADDITRARNDVINAQQGQNQAELRLTDARTSLYTKENKALNEHTAALGEFGAKLDQDLGISKGLAGIADNLVRFLGNLIAAPFLSQMSAIANAPGQAQGGFGLMAVLGAQGAFGPQYTAAGQAAASSSSSSSASAMGPAVLQPGGGGVPYGLPKGSNSGGYGGGGVQFPDWVNQLGAAFGVKPSTYPGHQESDRHEAGFAPNPQDLNRAIDWSGPVENMERFSEYLSSVPGSLEQLIFQNPQTGQQFGIAGGQDVSQTGYYAGDYGGHQDHVHTRQSESIPLPGGAQPGSPVGTASAPGISGSGGVVPVSVTNWPGAALGGPGPGQPPGQGPGAPQGAPGSGLNWDALAAKESGGNWGINTGNGYSGGLQFDPSTWAQYGGTQYAPSAGQATRDQQIAVAQQAYDARGGGSTLWPQNYGQLQAPGAPGGAPLPPPGTPGFGGNGMPFGLQQPGGGIGRAAGTRIGGVDPLQGTGKGGIGMTEGGSLDTALGLAATALPGVGQAAQTGAKLASRAIQYGGQVAGIMTQGALDTFLPFGGSKLAQNSWLTKIVGGIAGAAPALPNMAGKAAAAPEGQGQGQGGQGPTNNTTNIAVTNERATEDGTGKDIAWHQQQAAAMPGMP